MENKTKEQLVEDIKSLRQEVAELKQEKADRKRAERLLQALNEASRSMEQALTPDEIFSAVAGELKKLGFRCTVFLTDQGRKRLFLKYWSYETAAIKAAERLVGRKHEDFPILIEAVDEYGKTVWERQTVFIENVKDVIRQLFQPVLPGPSKKLAGPVAKLLKVSKDINAPLIAGDEVVGMLSVQSDDLTRDDMPAITAFAYQMAAAWHKATLLQDLKRNLAERNRAEEALQKAHDELERRVEERTAELVKLNEQLTREITERKRAEEELAKRAKIIDEVTDAVITTDLSGNITSYNSGAERMYGYKGQEVIGKPVSMFYSVEDVPEVMAQIGRLLEGSPISATEARIVGENKKEVPVILSLAPIRDSEGKMMELVGIAKDITERKRAGEMLKESEQKYRFLVENLDEIVLVLSKKGKILFANKKAVEASGYPEEELVGESILKFLTRDSIRKAFYALVQEFLGRPQPVLEVKIKTRSGRIRDLEIAQGSALVYEKGKQIGILVNGRDITERKEAEEALRESEEFSSSLLNNSPNAILVINPDTSIRYGNPAFEELTGFSSLEVIGVKAPYPWWTEETLHKTRRDFEEAIQQGARRVEELFQKKDGERFWAEMISVPVIRNGEFEYYLANWVDITERKRAEEKLKESEEKYRSLVNNIRLGIFRNTPGPTGKFLEVNPAMEEITGYSRDELLEMNVSDLYERPQEQRAFAEEIAAVGAKTITKELNFRRKDGTQIVVSDTTVAVRDNAGQVVWFDGILEDITERKQAEERVQHLNLVLRAIRTVNQVIARETDRSQLLKGICRSLTETRGYYNAWIALLDESGKLREYAESGLGDDFLPMKERLGRGELTHCARRALEQSSPIMTENPPLNCSDCPLSGNYEGRGGLTTRLRHGAKCYGVISLSTPGELLSDDEEVVLFREIAHDIAFALGSLELEERRKKAAEELEESEERYRAMVEAGADMGEAIFLLQDTDKVEGAHLFANQEWVRITGYTLEELRGISYLDLVHPRHRDAVADRVRRRFHGELLPGPWEISIMAKDGTEVPVEATGATLTYQGRPAVVGYIRDMTERKKAEEKLKASLEEKEVLLKEIHHRVKNNLQVISSLLKLQSGYIEDERYAEMFKESQERVMSMALVHEKLYQSKDLARIDFGEYVKGLKRELLRSYGAEAARIAIKAEVEGIRLGVGHAIPCGLIINELVSNCVKHAFPQGERGEVRIAMRQVGKDEVELEVSDNGIGLPESVGVRSTESLGLRLVSMLAEDQLGGEIKVDRGKGTRFRIRFRVGE